MTQKEQVLEILNEHRTQFTQLDAIREIGCLRLSERIRELEKDGIEIEHEAISVPNRNGRECRVMSYRLKQPADGTSGQDRKSYSDTQDRKSYTLSYSARRAQEEGEVTQEF